MAYESVVDFSSSAPGGGAIFPVTVAGEVIEQRPPPERRVQPRRYVCRSCGEELPLGLKRAGYCAACRSAAGDPLCQGAASNGAPQCGGDRILSVRTVPHDAE